MGERQWITLVLDAERSTFLECAMALVRPEAACRDWLLDR